MNVLYLLSGLKDYGNDFPSNWIVLSDYWYLIRDQYTQRKSYLIVKILLQY